MLDSAPRLVFSNRGVKPILNRYQTKVYHGVNRPSIFPDVAIGFGGGFIEYGLVEWGNFDLGAATTGTTLEVAKVMSITGKPRVL